MALIDLDKFVASFITEMKECSQMRNFSIPRCIKKALDDQGLEYKDGEIVKSQRRVSAEFKESGYGEPEDERIRKAIHIYLDWLDGRNKDYQPKGDYSIKDMIAWLEKQGSNLVKNGYTNNKDVIEYAGNYSREIWHKLMDNFKNIKDYHIGCNDVSDIVLNAIINTYNWLEKQDKQKHIEKDLEMVNPSDKAEQKPAWSEEDERIYQSIIDDTVQENQLDSKQIDWLKSLKQRYTWKPRDEQMKALDSAIDEFDGYREFDSLVSLKKDLEKLKRE